MAACKEFFGATPSQTAMDFAKEVRELTPADRAELAPMLSEELGAVITPA
jgi:hypothetical protein